MSERLGRTLAVAVLYCISRAAGAAGDADLRQLRDEVRLLKEQYERRIDSLEQRLAAAERASAAAAASAASAPATVTAASQAAPAASPGGAGASESAMNPAVSVILNGTYSNLSRDPATYRINGFVPTRGEVAPPDRGVSLAESELVLASNIDHYFRGTLIAALAPDNSVGVENAFIETLSLSNGFKLKAGRFFSAVGYQNEIHAHARDFADAPLASKVFLGNQLSDDGIQVKWVAPTELYVDLGAEFGRGRRFPAGPDGGRSKNGFGAANLFTHLGGDIGASTAWQAGLSYLATSPQDRSYSDTDSTGTAVTNSFTGKSRLLALSGILKWAPNGNATRTNFKLQGEYFHRSEDGTLAYNTGNAPGAALAGLVGSYSARQSGWYMQGVYQFMPQWRVGYRYDRLNAGGTRVGLIDSGALAQADLPLLGSYNPRRNTLMVDWSGSEFSRFRLQFARDQSRLGMIDDQVFLQYIVSLGAHGAHSF